MVTVMVCYQNRKVLIKTAMVRLIEYPSLRMRNYTFRCMPLNRNREPGQQVVGITQIPLLTGSVFINMTGSRHTDTGDHSETGTDVSVVIRQKM